MLPERIYYYINKQCNLACFYCYNDKRHLNQELSFSVISSFISYLKGKNVELIITGGEPTLHSHFFNIVDLLTENYINFKVYSNGFFSEDTLKKLSNQKFIKIHITPKYYEISQNKFVYQAIMDNINFLRNNSSLDISAGIIVTKMNQKFALKIRKDLIDIGIKKIRYSPIYPSPNNNINENEFYKKFIEDKRFTNFLMNINNSYKPNYFCFAGIKYCNIEYNNNRKEYDMYACSFYFINNKLKTAGAFKFDDLKQIPIIWNNKQIWSDFRNIKKGKCILNKK